MYSGEENTRDNGSGLNGSMRHKGINYGIHAHPHGKWQWIIYPKIGEGSKVMSEKLYNSRLEAELAVQAEIEYGMRGETSNPN